MESHLKNETNTPTVDKDDLLGSFCSSVINCKNSLNEKAKYVLENLNESNIEDINEVRGILFTEITCSTYFSLNSNYHFDKGYKMLKMLNHVILERDNYNNPHRKEGDGYYTMLYNYSRTIFEVIEKIEYSFTLYNEDEKNMDNDMDTDMDNDIDMDTDIDKEYKKTRIMENMYELDEVLFALHKEIDTQECLLEDIRRRVDKYLNAQSKDNGNQKEKTKNVNSSIDLHLHIEMVETVLDIDDTKYLIELLKEEYDRGKMILNEYFREKLRKL